MRPTQRVMRHRYVSALLYRCRIPAWAEANSENVDRLSLPLTLRTSNFSGLLLPRLASFASLREVDTRTTEALKRAATWYVAAFAAINALLLAGVRLSGVDWTKAGHPYLAITALATAVAAVGTVAFLASRVLTSDETLLKLRGYEQKAIRKAQKRTGNLAPDLHAVAREHWLLRKLVSNGFLDQMPTDLWQKTHQKTDESAELANSITAAATYWRAFRSFRIVQIVAPIASVIVLVATICWSQAIKPLPVEPPVGHPKSVTLTLLNGIDPSSFVGQGCSARELTGVAIQGNIHSRIVVVLPAQSGCPSAIVDVTPLMPILIKLDD